MIAFWFAKSSVHPTPEVRALLDLFYVDGFSVPELAEAFGTPEGTIKSRLHTARARIRAALEAHP
jgi:RNA polymerase sigma-70 factor (ECF subfamily)